jgi:alkylation response protein AidB-like acyl-CoA dehydrogenase
VALAGPSAFACLDPESAGAPFFAEAGIRHLATRAATIYSGTSEIHRNVMARHLLDFRPNAPA